MTFSDHEDHNWSGSVAGDLLFVVDDWGVFETFGGWLHDVVWVGELWFLWSFLGGGLLWCFLGSGLLGELLKEHLVAVGTITEVHKGDTGSTDFSSLGRCVWLEVDSGSLLGELLEEHLVAVGTITEVLETDDNVFSRVDLVDANVLSVEHIVGQVQGWHGWSVHDWSVHDWLGVVGNWNTHVVSRWHGGTVSLHFGEVLEETEHLVAV